MAECPKCRANLPDNVTTCPSCGPVPPVSKLPSQEESANGRVAITVTAPIQRQRSLQRSCLVGLFLFLPTIAFVVILFHYYYKNSLKQESPEDAPRVEMPANKVEENLGEVRLAKLRELQSESNLRILQRFKVSNDAILTVTVNDEWDGLKDVYKRMLAKQWFKQWKELGGDIVEVHKADGLKAVKINPVTGEVRIAPGG